MKKYFFILCLLLALGAQAQRISTFAGTGGVGGYTGDGGPATAAKIFYTNGIVIDAIGNMYITADGYPSVRKVDTAGIINTIAGSSINLPGFSGDGGPATAAKMSDPRGITLDKKGNIYFFDMDNRRIRKIDTGGIITTYAGNGTNISSGDGGPATAAGLGNSGGGVTADTAGNLFIASGNFIRKVDTAGIITTIAGSGIAGHSGDGGMADTAQIVTGIGQIIFDKYGNLYIACGLYVRKINTSGIITTIAGNSTGTYTSGTPATATNINYTVGVYPDNNGNLYLANYTSYRIYKVNPAGIITTIAGSGTTYGFSGDGGPGTAAKLYRPHCVYMGKNNCLYIADQNNYCVRRLDLNDSVFVSVPGVAQNEDAVKVYPNPAGDGVLHVRVSSAADEGVQVALIDVTGKKVHEQTTTTNKETTMTLHTPPGLYLLHISKADKQWVQKVLVE